MRSEILERGLLRAIPGGEPLSLEAYSSADGRLVEGVLRRLDGYWYPIVDGVPSFLGGVLRPDLETFQERHGLQAVSDQPVRHAAASELSFTPLGTGLEATLHAARASNV